MLTARCLELGTVYVENLGLWDIVQPHLEALVAQTHESSSLAQLDGSDIVYVGRVAVPKLIALAVTIGTRFPAPSTSLGKVLLADLSPGAAGAHAGGAESVRGDAAAHPHRRGACCGAQAGSCAGLGLDRREPRLRRPVRGCARCETAVARWSLR